VILFFNYINKSINNEFLKFIMTYIYIMENKLLKSIFDFYSAK